MMKSSTGKFFLYISNFHVSKIIGLFFEIYCLQFSRNYVLFYKNKLTKDYLLPLFLSSKLSCLEIDY